MSKPSEKAMQRAKEIHQTVRRVDGECIITVFGMTIEQTAEAIDAHTAEALAEHQQPQPMSTAPKDDTRILAYYPHYGWCTAERKVFTSINGKVYDYWENAPDACRESSYFSDGDTPLCWLPLPPEPESSGT